LLFILGEHVAIKVIDKAKLNKEGLEQLSHEIRLWSILSGIKFIFIEIRHFRLFSSYYLPGVIANLMFGGK